ncbi:haloacid dehalogenase-like hydrolase domain-containing protein 2 [Jimgerdemannia flammicorona]|uniref:Haloacid dehalogenase-like hydrolase domain-containing protein 2 n=1 Tax=Jimgerdemannia flammicorona TaxID=994334 RepID=A0A433QTQ0_9FUNG|nr:haloacid dehalogenase-like hydrolase domain-containing protein 2 [Jimgerdemannia flammicorona]
MSALSQKTKEIKAILIDITGTILFHGKLVDGSIEGLRHLRESGIPIFTTLKACRNLVASKGLRPLLLLDDISREEFDDIPTSEPNNAVIIGHSPTSFRYELVGV